MPRRKRVDDPNDKPEFMTQGEVADLLRCTEDFVRKLMQDGDLPYNKLSPRLLRFRRKDVEALLKRTYRSA